MTVENLLASISSRELSEWAAYCRLRNEDQRDQALEADALTGANQIRNELRSR